ncbi:MAG: siderophore-interacting protein [Rhizobiaceae bacterium MnEN-MB40S]|nr:MAG: siderophore-interacting protein [Rhizobiaceae bacterium MnEN-MB40S]
MSATAYKIFEIELLGRTFLTPNMARLTFGGEQVAGMRTEAPDQRVKLFFPRSDGAPSAIPDRPDWYRIYKSAPPAERAPMRTYTIRKLDADARRLVIDFVLHGETGPASRWAINAEPGDRLQISAPNRLFDGNSGGFDWDPPADIANVLLIADETALPAVAGILEQMYDRGNTPATQAFIEVPSEDDRQQLPDWQGLEVNWLARNGRADGYGAGMIRSAQAAVIPETAVTGGDADSGCADIDSLDVDRDILWDRASAAGDQFYGWVAGETAAVSQIRKHFLKDLRIDRKHLTMMGYWRHGKPHV